MPTHFLIGSLMLLSMPLITPVNSHRILGLFIHKIRSHFDVFYPVMNGLAENGHNVTVLSFFSKAEQSHANYNEIILNYDTRSTVTDRSKVPANRVDPSNNIFSYFGDMIELKKWGEHVCALTLNSTMLDNLLAIHRREPFDLVVTELFITDCMLGVVAHMSVPYVGISSCNLLSWLYDRVSQPVIPSYIPTATFGFTENMPFQQRVLNWIGTIGTQFIWHYRRYNEIYLLRQKFGDTIPDTKAIANNVSLILVNQHYSSSFVQPMVRKVIEIGGIHIGDEKPLPKVFLFFLDEIMCKVYIYVRFYYYN